MLPNYFDFIFVHLRQTVRLKPEISPKLLSTLGLNLARTRPEKLGSIYNSTFSNTRAYLCSLGVFPGFIIINNILQPTPLSKTFKRGRSDTG